MDFKNVKSLSNVHYLWSPDFLNFDDIFKIDRVRGGLQSVKIKKPPGMCFKITQPLTKKTLERRLK